MFIVMVGMGSVRETAKKLSYQGTIFCDVITNILITSIDYSE